MVGSLKERMLKEFLFLFLVVAQWRAYGTSCLDRWRREHRKAPCGPSEKNCSRRPHLERFYTALHRHIHKSWKEK